jgi:hypothetical protein
MVGQGRALKRIVQVRNRKKANVAAVVAFRHAQRDAIFVSLSPSKASP